VAVELGFIIGALKILTGKKDYCKENLPCKFENHPVEFEQDLSGGENDPQVSPAG
jgi:hypothetical protein